MNSCPYHSVFAVVLVLFKHMQHGVMKGWEEHGGQELVIEEHAAVQLLQDVHCQHTGSRL